MSVLFYIVGAIAIMSGVAMIGYGIPINEFSFGNTLILAGTTTAIGGIIVLAIGAAIAQLQRLTDALGAQTPVRAGRPLETFDQSSDARAAQGAGRIPFPPKSRAEQREPQSFDPRMAPVGADASYDDRPGTFAPPTMRNPEMPPAEDYHEMPSAPAQNDFAEPPQPAPPLGANGGMPERHSNAGLGRPAQPPPAARPRPPQTRNFDAMWPAAEPKSDKSPAGIESRPPELPARDAAPEAAKPRPADEPRSAAILKSGVVDGMGYTLYVDGSIEAELPQGTLRFGSINDLRNHLSKTV